MGGVEGGGFGGNDSGGGGGAEVGLYLMGDSCSRKARSSGSRLRRGSAVSEVEEGSGLELENQLMAVSWRWNQSRQRTGTSCSMTFPISCGTRSGVPGAKDAKPHVQDQSKVPYGRVPRPQSLQSSSISDHSYLKTELTYGDTVSSTTMVQLLVRCEQFSKADSAQRVTLN